jgi:PP-loop superfamily ATP-utilizing enzyme
MLIEDIQKKIVAKLREVGFSYIAVDLEGYTQGSMNRDI